MPLGLQGAFKIDIAPMKRQVRLLSRDQIDPGKQGVKRVYAVLSHVCLRLIRHINLCALNDSLRIIGLEWLTGNALSCVTDEALILVLGVARLGRKFRTEQQIDRDSEEGEEEEEAENEEEGAGGEGDAEGMGGGGEAGVDVTHSKTAEARGAAAGNSTTLQGVHVDSGCVEHAEAVDPGKERGGHTGGGEGEERGHRTGSEQTQI